MSRIRTFPSKEYQETIIHASITLLTIADVEARWLINVHWTLIIQCVSVDSKRITYRVICYITFDTYMQYKSGLSYGISLYLESFFRGIYNQDT